MTLWLGLLYGDKVSQYFPLGFPFKSLIEPLA